jgi:hypothetical protein
MNIGTEGGAGMSGFIVGGPTPRKVNGPDLPMRRAEGSQALSNIGSVGSPPRAR